MDHFKNLFLQKVIKCCISIMETSSVVCISNGKGFKTFLREIYHTPEVKTSPPGSFALPVKSGNFLIKGHCLNYNKSNYSVPSDPGCGYIIEYPYPCKAIKVLGEFNCYFHDSRFIAFYIVLANVPTLSHRLSAI